MGAVLASTCDGQATGIMERQTPEGTAVREKLVGIVQQRPYLTRKVHRAHHWIERCQDCLAHQKVSAAQDHIDRILAAVNADAQALQDTYRKFDISRSGLLEIDEFEHFVSYVGFGVETAQAILRDIDNEEGVVTLESFEKFVGRVGGVQDLFEQVRDAVAKTADQVNVGISSGSRVRAYSYDDGLKSPCALEAEVRGTSSDGQRVRLTFAKSGEHEVPRDWIAEDTDLVAALEAIGCPRQDQHFWTMLLPASEQYAVMALAERQSLALKGVREQATLNHNSAVGPLRERCREVGIEGKQLWAMLTWVRDLAPIIVHVDLDVVGEFLETDTHYRNQFETSSSKGLLCPQKREEWERNLFGDCYDDAPPFERPKYGVLDVMNDHRGVLCARDYGDSYLVLKNARLRCTFAPVDSGGITGSRLAVLDQYAHVLLEFSDDELREVARIASAEEGSADRIGDSAILVGFNYKEAQIHGEIDLKKHVKRLVVHPRHMVDGFSPERIRKVCDTHGWEFLWMQEEKKRRIYEERESRDSWALERRWASQDCIDLV